MKWFRSSKNKVQEKNDKKHLTGLEKKPKDETLKGNSETITKKSELVKKEYDELVGNLMASKRELKKIRSDIQTSKNEYEQLVSKIKSERMLLLKVNNEMKEMDENTKKTKEEYQKQGLVIQEVNNSKKELSEIREEIKKYNNELELVKTKTENTPQLISLKEEKKKLEDEIMQKRKDVQTHVKELKFIQNEMIDTGNKERSTKVVDAASAVVASMNQKLQTTLTELNAVKKALENERGRKKSSA